MKVHATRLPGLLLLEPDRFGDARGFFLESYNKRAFRDATGLEVEFVQDNHSRSARNVLRGLHYQVRQPQGKLVRVVSGAVFDVAVDLRHGSPSFGRWAGFTLAADACTLLWIPPGFAHGFLVLSDHADFLYKTTEYYASTYERTLLWNDPEVGIDWPLAGETPILADKDRCGVPLRAAA